MINKVKIYESFVKVLSLLPVSVLIKVQKKQLILPMYHVVSDERLPHVIHLFNYRNVKQFEKDLDFFQKYFSPVSLNDLINSLKGNMNIPDNSFLLSFDDGHKQVIDVIAPILKRRSIPAVFFLNSAFLDNKDMSFRYKSSLIIDKLQINVHSEVVRKLSKKLNVEEPTLANIKKAILRLNYQDRRLLDDIAKIMDIDFYEYLQEKRPYLTSEDVRSLIDQGFEIGSHSIDHPLFRELSIHEQLEQVKESFKILNEKFDLPVNAFAFPFTDNGVGKEFFDKTHFNGPIDISFGTSDFSKGHCDNNFKRQPMERWNDSASGIYKKLLSSEILRNILGSNQGRT